MRNRICYFKEVALYYFDVITRPLLVLIGNVETLINCHHLPRKLSKSDLEKLRKLLEEEKEKHRL